jgi:hypothetical protein
MAGLFRRSQPHGGSSISREEIESLLPASVRHPETNRFTPLGSDFDGEDGADEDVEFLESIVKAVDGGEQPVARLAPVPPVFTVPVTTPSPARQIALAGGDELSLFREATVEQKERTVLQTRVDIADVEMFDLVEDLATTAAALRRRKAA